MPRSRCRRRVFLLALLALLPIALLAGFPGVRAEPAPASPPPVKESVVRSVKLAGDAEQTRLTVDMTVGVPAEIYTLADPYRIVIDLPDVTFRLPEGTGRQTQGLVKAFRYGLLSERKGRIVLDTDGPVAVAKAEMTSATDRRSIELAVALVPVDAASFAAKSGPPPAPPASTQPPPASQKRAEPELRPTLPPSTALPETTAEPATSRARPLIIVDPGHGGIDPGAVGASSLLEKNVVLAVARELRTALTARGRYDIVMTRATDVFISLDERVRISETRGADLFISIHADSVDAAPGSKAVQGATVYTLSDRASDEAARRMAEKENASDLLAGVASTATDGKDDVRNILIDLIKRETSNFSSDFSRTLVGRMRKSVSLAKEPQRSAAFKVLRQTGSPSVLIELGYLSNPDEEQRLANAAWQKQIAAAIADAVDAYFARHVPKRPAPSGKAAAARLPASPGLAETK